MAMFILLALVCLQAYHAASDEYLIPKDIDVDEIIKNDRLTKNYIDCILEKGKCTPEGEQLKNAVPEALQNECAKCNDKHKEGVRKVLRHLIKNKPNWWEELAAKYDPKGEYKTRYTRYLEEEKLKY